MVSIRIPVERESEFLDLYYEWKRELMGPTLLKNVALPATQRMNVDGYFEFPQVEDAFLPRLVERGYPFKLS